MNGINKSETLISSKVYAKLLLLSKGLFALRVIAQTVSLE
jgi:hypothetical protein